MLKCIEVNEKDLTNITIWPKLFIRILTYIQLANPSTLVKQKGCVLPAIVFCDLCACFCAYCSNDLMVKNVAEKKLSTYRSHPPHSPCN